jgi:hypothetical protein
VNRQRSIQAAIRSSPCRRFYPNYADLEALTLRPRRIFGRPIMGSPLPSCRGMLRPLRPEGEPSRPSGRAWRIRDWRGCRRAPESVAPSATVETNVPLSEVVRQSAMYPDAPMDRPRCIDYRAISWLLPQETDAKIVHAGYRAAYLRVHSESGVKGCPPGIAGSKRRSLNRHRDSPLRQRQEAEILPGVSCRDERRVAG